MQYIYNSIGFLLSKVFHYRFSVSLQNIARAFPKCFLSRGGTLS